MCPTYSGPRYGNGHKLLNWHIFRSRRMPLVKIPKAREPNWKEWDKQAQKEGLRAPITSVNGDVYTGEWKNNKKDGKGTQEWAASGDIYDGDWEEGVRQGFGTLSVREARNGHYVKKYSGGWKNDKKHGYGTNFYSESEHYEGEWQRGQRGGWGKMSYQDGSMYEGEWLRDQRSGKGLLRLPNGNRYEGMWERDMKNGEGRFLHLDKGQVYTGVWVDDIAKCGIMEDVRRESAPDPPPYPIPQCSLQDLDDVLTSAREQLAQHNLSSF